MYTATLNAKPLFGHIFLLFPITQCIRIYVCMAMCFVYCFTINCMCKFWPFCPSVRPSVWPSVRLPVGLYVCLFAFLMYSVSRCTQFKVFIFINYIMYWNTYMFHSSCKSRFDLEHSSPTSVNSELFPILEHVHYVSFRRYYIYRLSIKNLYIQLVVSSLLRNLIHSNTLKLTLSEITLSVLKAINWFLNLNTLFTIKIYISF